MSIETNLERIANALEKIAGGFSIETSALKEKPATPSASKKSGGTSKKAEKDESGASKSDVRAALKNLQKASSAAAARDLLAENGAKTLTDLDPKLYASVIESAKERAK